MTQIPTHFDTGANESSERPPFSLTAILSLVFSLIFCVPGAALLGLVLGFFGIVRTAGGARRGRGLAISGSLLSLVVLAGWISLMLWFWPYVTGTMEVSMKGPQTTLQAAFDGDSEKARDLFLPRSRPSKDQVEAFASAATSRFGEYQGFTYPNPERAGDVNQRIPISVRFASGAIPGSVVFSDGNNPSRGDGPEDLAFMHSSSDGLVSFFLIESIRLEPKDGPPLTLGDQLVPLSQDDSDDSGESSDSSEVEEADTAGKASEGADS